MCFLCMYWQWNEYVVVVCQVGFEVWCGIDLVGQFMCYCQGDIFFVFVGWVDCIWVLVIMIGIDCYYEVVYVGLYVDV